MPECSPSRSTIFTGRFPLRTGVDAAILSYDLPAAQVSPYEVTTPRVLANAGYKSAMVGKYHLGGPDNNPDGFGAPAALGWDYYLGNLQGGPPFIDPTLGGQITDDSLYPCGFPIGEQRGPCWFEGQGGTAILDHNGGLGYTGHECVVMGGNLDKVVDDQDLDGVMAFQGQPSVFDFNKDGIPDQADIDCVLLNFGNLCSPGNPGTPCPATD